MRKKKLQTVSIQPSGSGQKMDFNEDLWQSELCLFLFLMMSLTHFFLPPVITFIGHVKEKLPLPLIYKYQRVKSICLETSPQDEITVQVCRRVTELTYFYLFFFCFLVRRQLTKTPPGTPAGCSVVCVGGRTTRILLAEQRTLSILSNCGHPTRLLSRLKRWPLILERY